MWSRRARTEELFHADPTPHGTYCNVAIGVYSSSYVIHCSVHSTAHLAERVVRAMADDGANWEYSNVVLHSREFQGFFIRSAFLLRHAKFGTIIRISSCTLHTGLTTRNYNCSTKICVTKQKSLQNIKMSETLSCAVLHC